MAEVLGRWHLRDRGWEGGGDAAMAHVAPGASGRFYYRPCCADGLLCEGYHDAASGRWVLDRVLD